MKADWHTCLPVPCPLCGKVTNYIRMEQDNMCTLFCGCLMSQEDWCNIYRTPLPVTVTKPQKTRCQWCHTNHVPGKGCSA